MSTEMGAVKTYCEALAADLRTRAKSVERLNANLNTELQVSLGLTAVRNLASMLEQLSSITFGLENLADVERRRAEAAESATIVALAVIQHLKGQA